MKIKFLSVLLVLVMLVPTLAACSSGVSNETDSGTDAESSAQGESAGQDSIPETLPLVTDGRSDYIIVRGENASDMETKAAEELQSYLKQISGAELPIVTDSTAPVVKEIVIGQTNREADGQFAREELANDGFIIQTDAGKLWLIGGNEYGTLYAVYELLESYLGCRFYTATFEKVPETKNISLKIEEDKQIPVFETRHIYWHDMTSNPQLMNKQKLRVAGAWAGGACHTLPELAEVGEHKDPCLLLPQTYDTVLKNVRAKLAATPGARYISVSQADGSGYCQCDSCAASAEEKGWSGHYLEFVNRIAEEIADEYPDVLIHTFAYHYTVEPPKTDIVPADNIMIQLCTIEACFLHPLDECDFAAGMNETPKDPIDFSALMEKWSALSSYLSIWDYTTNYSSYSSLFPNFQVLRQNVRLFAETNVKYLFEQGAYQSTNGEFSELRSYLLARLAWDPYMSEEEYNNYMYEFMADYYGPGWEYILEYIEAGTQALSDRHLHIFTNINQLFPAINDNANKNREDYPTDITVEMLRDYENTDWSPYYGWYGSAKPVEFVQKGYDQFAAAMEMAETDEQRAHIDKSSLQLDMVSSYIWKPNMAKAKNALNKIYPHAVEQAVAAGSMDETEGDALIAAFKEYIVNALDQEVWDANRALAEKLIEYKAYHVEELRCLSSDTLGELNFYGVPCGPGDWWD